MDLTMTIGATAIKKEWRIFSARRHRVLCDAVALCAQSRIGYLEQPVVDRAMSLVTVGAIFRHWRMLVQERTPSLRVAGVTVFVDAGLFELRRIGRAVWIVTTRAG